MVNELLLATAVVFKSRGSLRWSATPTISAYLHMLHIVATDHSSWNRTRTMHHLNEVRFCPMRRKVAQDP